MLYSASQKPPFGKGLALSFQHVFAMFGATILVPLLTGLPVNVSLFTSGVGTLIYILITKAKVPVYLGSSFAFISSIIIASGYHGVGTGNYGSTMTAIMVVGFVYVLVAAILHFVKGDWLKKVLPPVVIGPAIIIIGLGLSQVAIKNSGLLRGDNNYQDMIISVASLIIVLIVLFKAKGFMRIIPFLFGIFGGFLIAAVLGAIDFKPLIEVLKTPQNWFKVPDFMFLGLTNKKISFLSTNITIHKISFQALFTIVPLSIVTISEHIGDHAVLGKITGQNYLVNPGLKKTLLGDGVATIVAALFGGPANTTYGENTSVVGMTKVASVWVTGGAALIAIAMSFCNIIVTLISLIPASVMGGISIVLYGFISINGLKVLIDNKVDMSKTKNLIIVSTMLVVGLGNAFLPFDKNGINGMSGMSLATLIGVLLNFVLPSYDKLELTEGEEPRQLPGVMKFYEQFNKKNPIEKK